MIGLQANRIEADRTIAIMPGVAAKLLTPKRLEILRELKKSDSESVSELAERVGRSLNTVSRDLSELSEYGFVELEKDGRAKKPRLAKENILVVL